MMIGKEEQIIFDRQLTAEETLKAERDMFLSIWMEKLYELGVVLYENKMDFQDKDIKSTFKNITRLLNRKNELDPEINRCRLEMRIE